MTRLVGYSEISVNIARWQQLLRGTIGVTVGHANRQTGLGATVLFAHDDVLGDVDQTTPISPWRWSCRRSDRKPGSEFR